MGFGLFAAEKGDLGLSMHGLDLGVAVEGAVLTVRRPCMDVRAL